MEVIRYKYIFVLIALALKCVKNETPNKNRALKETTTNCPFTKIIEDIFKIHNRSTETGIYLKDTERAKIFLSSIANITTSDDIDDSNIHVQDKLVNGIIASINRIKNNITSDKNNDTKLNEAIILNVPKDNTKKVNNKSEPSSEEETKLIGNIKSGIEDKIDTIKSQNIFNLNANLNKSGIMTKPIKSDTKTSTEKTNYVEVLTIEPNNTNINNTSSRNIMEVLKHLMPLFNSSLTKELHNLTIIERVHNRNHSFTSTKNVSTIIVTYCDKENFTKVNTTQDIAETDLMLDINNETVYNDDIQDTSGPSDENYEDNLDNLTVGEKKDILEAAKYGVEKMHELYSVLEPKLYYMGLWLDDTNPARYVAAFNAPSEDAGKYSRYGYASLQAAAKLKQLTSTGNDGLEGRTEEAQFPAASALRQSPLLEHCPLKGAPKCPPASKRYRTHDGTCNNVNRPRWGSTMTPVQRFLPASYSDGIQSPRRSVFGAQLPSARDISSLIHEDHNVESPGITHLLMQWGQFLDHDVTSSSQSRGFNGSVPRCCKDGGRDFIPKEFMHPECLPIAVPATDPFYGPKGVRCLDFVRSSPAPRDDCALGWREQLNQVSAYIDGSPLYASSARQSDKLRLFRNGMLQYGRLQQRRPLLPPERKDELCRGGAVSTDCFKSGDARVNEHPGLVAAHIVWLRHHNRLAQELSHMNPHWSDEKIYQETRKVIGAMIQHITYREFLPIVLGTEVMRLFDLEPQKKGYYRGYDLEVNPSPASSFGSAAFRFGHSLVQSSMMRYDRFHRPINNNVSLHNELTNPSNIWSIGAIDRLLLGMVNQPIQKRDEFITEELTNHLFQTPQFSFGMDLAAINIQRGRDHGIPSYTAWREPCGLSVIQDFDDLFRIMPTRVVRKLQALYRHVDDIDLFTGGMAERPVVGGLVGPTFACIIAQQFANLRKGDRFWYENGGFDSSFTPAQLQQIRRISFAQILCHTLDNIDSIQPFVFLASDNPDNNRISCRNGLLNDFDLSPWTEINADFNNDINKSDNDLTITHNTSTQRVSTQKPKRTKATTTTIKPTTKKEQKVPVASSNKVNKNKPASITHTENNKLAHNHNKTDTTFKDNDKNNVNLTVNNDNTKPNVTKTVQSIDDKLDFKNKSKRYEDSDSIDTRHKYNTANKYNDYDDEENVQSVQSVVINNLSHKRPYNNYNYNNRPVMTVTENIDKYTYLINYVPRPTESWRQTTRRNNDRDVVKVTYQTYDDTYRRPNKPYYYNRPGNYDNNNYYRRDRPNTDKETFHSSARSNEETVTTTKPSVTFDKFDNVNPTTENLHKLVTFSYVGTYKGNYETNNRVTKDDITNKDLNPDMISKDFSTYDFDNPDLTDKINSMKLSTFFHYETATKPYNNIQRPTRRHDDESVPNYPYTNTKYYYIKNVLHRFPDYASSMTDKPQEKYLNDHNPKRPEENIEERTALDKLSFLDDVENVSNLGKLRIKIKKPTSPAKTPSVAFQVIPSENAPSQWAVYEENADLPEGLPHRMPPIKTDPYALKEIPRPMTFAKLRRRRPGRS